MAILVTAQGIGKSFGVRPLFEGVGFTVSDGERIGLIGPNGAGKSTLLRILAGQDSVDHGTLSLRQRLRVGYLAQVPAFTPGRTVRETVLDGAAELTDPDLAWQVAARADKLIARLELGGPGAGAAVPVETLSGGWRKRVALARELVREPELLLLDEPTNHLDVESIVWLERMLASAPFATITISHDRYFLQHVAARILELDRRHAGGMLAVDGDYATFLERKAELMAAQERRETALRNTLRRETEWLRRGPPARTTKQEARIQRAGALADEVDELSTRNQVRTVDLGFAGLERRPKRLIEARGISKAYGQRTVFERLDLLVGPGSRIGLLGPNGCGKSTLLRVLVGQEPPSAGDVLRADGLQVAYFEQQRESLDASATVTDAVCPGGDHVDFRGTRVHVHGYLARFLFRAEQMKMPVGQLSGGEQSRLVIARLMLRPANVLVLDEPTNDLDVATLDVLEEALTSFDGAVLLVTHDRYFLDRVATQILAFHTRSDEHGRVTPFSGLSQWQSWIATQAAAATPAVPRPALAAEAPGPRRKLSFKDQREWDAIEGRIAEAEARVAALAAEMERPEVVVDGARLMELEPQLAAARADVDRLYERWAELQSMVDSLAS